MAPPRPPLVCSHIHRQLGWLADRMVRGVSCGPEAHAALLRPASPADHTYPPRTPLPPPPLPPRACSNDDMPSTQSCSGITEFTVSRYSSFYSLQMTMGALYYIRIGERPLPPPPPLVRCHANAPA